MYEAKQQAALDALENMHENAGIPALIETARSPPNRQPRKRAINQPGESDDPCAHAGLAKLLDERR